MGNCEGDRSGEEDLRKGGVVFKGVIVLIAVLSVERRGNGDEFDILVSKFKDFVLFNFYVNFRLKQLEEAVAEGVGGV